MLRCKHFAGSAKAGLNLVQYQHRPGFAAVCFNALEVVMRARPHAAFSLDRLHDEGCGLVSDGPAGFIQVVERNVRESGHQRLKGLSVLLVPGSAQSAHGFAVIATHRGYDLRPASSQPGKLEGAFNRLGAGVAEKKPGNTRGCQPGQRLQKESALIVVEQLGAVNELLGLFLKGLINVGILMPDVGCSLAADAVNVLLPLLTPKPGTLTANDHQLSLVVGPGSIQVLDLRNGPNCCLRHSRSPQSDTLSQVSNSCHSC